MTDEEILDTLRAALAYAQPDFANLASQVAMNTAFSDLNVDSLSLLEMASFVEHRLSLTFTDEEMMQLRGVREFVALIRARKGST